MEGLKETLHEFLELIPVVEEILVKQEDLSGSESLRKTLSELKRNIQRELSCLEEQDE